ncbi:hypothetical protein EUX98_g1367 [Antrodiella citrinella]|uniref:Uncharacterized protein n=1 Tax=Antrodiella citrinella TaxID=2447956 RepID=A0A4V3XJF3_9APHY|nr:hypothetical protein EUX98_g1367 [Antrodiella citrinella]
MWTSCCEVSRDFKTAVECVIIIKHLPKTLLRVKGGMRDTHGTVHLTTRFLFSSLDPEHRTRAIFRTDAVKEHAKPHVVKHLKSVFIHEAFIAQPQIIARIRRFANDTFLPDLEPDCDELEMKVNWTRVFSEYFKEDKEHIRHMTVHVEQFNPKILEMREMDILQRGLNGFANARETAWRKILTERIIRNVLVHTHIESWCDPDEQGFEELQLIRDKLSYSD